MALVTSSIHSNRVERFAVRPQPTNEESLFRFDELFFSVTDSTSAIQFANDVFLRVAKYSSDEIMGQFHNIIRHPDIPKAAFRIMWEYLNRKESLAVYVKNLAKDGSYYWVIALIFPIKGGYLSIRLKPGSPVFKTVKKLYNQVLTTEKELLDILEKEQAIEQSKTYLLELLKNEGFSDYSQFMHYALLQELHHRTSITFAKSKRVSKKAVNELDERLQIVDDILTDLVKFSHELNKIHTSLIRESKFLLNLSENIGSIAHNARLMSSKLDSTDRSLFVISEVIGEQAKAGGKNLNELLDAVSDLDSIFSKLSFNIISAKLQVEMSRYYNYDLETSNSSHTQFLGEYEAMQLLTESFKPRLQKLVDAKSDIKIKKRLVLGGINEIERFLTILRFILITGKVEIPRLQNNRAMFEDIFHNLATQINSADNYLDKLRAVITNNEYLFNDFDKQNDHLQEVCTSLK